jgi:hypothetical protein
MSGSSRWLLAMALALLLGVGCSGLLAESFTEDGRRESLRVQGGEGWKSWDLNPRKADEGCLLLKKESTF